MPEFAFTETHLQKTPEVVGQTVQGASFVMHVAIHTDAPIERPIVNIKFDGPMLKTIPHARKSPPSMSVHKGDAFTVSYSSSGGTLEPNEPMEVTVYSKTQIRVLSVNASSL